MSFDEQMDYSPPKEEFLYGNGGIDGIADWDITQDKDIDVYGLGNSDGIHELVVEAPEVRIRQYQTDKGDFDNIRFELENHPDDEASDIIDYADSENVDEKSRELVETFWRVSYPELRLN